MSVKSELAALTTLTGVNYPVWADEITAYLKSKGLFRIVSGALKAPASTEDTYEAWMAKDEQAQGIIQMKISPAIRTKLNTQFLVRSSGTAGVAVTTSVSAVGQHIAGATHQSTTPTSNHYWSYLHTTYGQPGIMAIHGHYRDMLAIRIAEGQNPVKGLDAIQAAYDKLVQHEAAPDDKTLAMIMIVALPKSFDALAPYIMTKKSMKEVKSDEVRHQAITLFETRNQRTNRPEQAHKATAVKPAFKAKTSFTAQTQPAQPQQGQRDGNPRQRQPWSQKKGKGKPNKGKGRAHSAHVADTDAEEDDDNNFASVAVESERPSSQMRTANARASTTSALASNPRASSSFTRLEHMPLLERKDSHNSKLFTLSHARRILSSRRVSLPPLPHPATIRLANAQSAFNRLSRTQSSSTLALPTHFPSQGRPVRIATNANPLPRRSRSGMTRNVSTFAASQAAPQRSTRVSVAAVNSRTSHLPTCGVIGCVNACPAWVRTIGVDDPSLHPSGVQWRAATAYSANPTSAQSARRTTTSTATSSAPRTRSRPYSANATQSRPHRQYRPNGHGTLQNGRPRRRSVGVQSPPPVQPVTEWWSRLQAWMAWT
jgi:hypothetical protein